MIGVIVNAAAILFCSIAGLFIKGAKKYEKPVMNAMGLAVIFLGVSGGVKGLTDPNANTLLFVISLVLGTVIGEITDIDGNFQRFGEFLGSRLGKEGVFAKGFVAASLLFCVGAMAIVGSFESGLTGNHSILFTKSVMDGVTSIILASALGVGVAFSAVSVFIYQGVLTVFSSILSPFITPDSIRELQTVGNVLIAAIGLDLLDIKKIKYANMLPAIFIPMLIYAPFVQQAIQSILNVFCDI